MFENSNVFIPGKPYTLVSMQPQQFLQKVFNKYDLDNNKRISKFQFQDIIRTLTKTTGAPFPNAIDIEDIFVSLDADGDETISFSEFKQLFKCFSNIVKETGLKIKYKKEQ